MNAEAVDGTYWHFGVMQAGLNFTDGQSYTLRFQTRADAPHGLNVEAKVDNGDYRFVGLKEKLTVGEAWQTYTLTFRAIQPVANHGVIMFYIGEQTGKVWLKDIVLISP
jgi:hypothetical protein